MRAGIAVAALLLSACGDIGPGVDGRTDAKAQAPDQQQSPPTMQSVAASSIRTASDARYHIEQAGFGNVAAMGQDSTGRWTATAALNGRNVNVMIDDQGVVQVVEPAAAK